MGGCFNFTNNKDRALFEKALEESISIFGISLEYWRVDRDATKDELYNEDTKPKIIQKYNLKAHGSTFDETFTLSRFGIESPDEYLFLISKTAFEQEAGDDEAPHEGDYIFLEFQDRIFQIAEVRDDKSVFLQNKFAYELTVRPADLDGTTTEPNIGVDDLSILEGIDDTENIDTASEEIIVTKTEDLDPFGEWS